MENKLRINFVPATESSNNDIFFGKSENKESNNEIQKPNASKIYQEVLSMPSTSTQHAINSQTITSICKLLPQSTPDFKTEDIFKFCHHGQLKLCKQWLTWGGDVNARDQFQWTPLMVAVSGGHQQIVELLIKSGANPMIFDSRNLNAFDYAEKSGHGHLIKMMKKLFKQEETQTKTEKTETNSRTNVNQPSAASFECDVCGPVTDQSRVAHLLSITHQLKSKNFSSEQTRALGNFAHINPRFMGYQMLRREGWNGYTGLGAREDGRKYPVQAQPNPGRACIGLPQRKPETASTQTTNLPPTQGKLKHRLKHEDQKRRQFEAEYRRSFY